MPASAASPTSSIPASSRSWNSRAISASTTSNSIATTCSATRSASPGKSAPPSICSARSPARWRSALWTASISDPTLPNVAGVIGDGALIWQPTALTTAKLSATSQVYETVVDGASGEFSRDLTLEVDHAFRYWLIGILKTGYGNDVYPGAGLQDNRWFASIGATYKLTRELQLNGTIRQDWQIATQPGFVFNATSFLLGLRVQR